MTEADSIPAIKDIFSFRPYHANEKNNRLQNKKEVRRLSRYNFNAFINQNRFIRPKINQSKNNMVEGFIII